MKIAKFFPALLQFTFAVNALLLAQTAASQDITELGGATTSEFTGHNSVQLPPPNISSEDRRLFQISGFGIFHGRFDRNAGLGPRFVNNSCGGCHIQNGRGPLAFSRPTIGGTAMVIRIALRGLTPSGAPRPVPRAGLQIQDQLVNGRSRYHIRLRWKFMRGAYSDGTRYLLRKPKLHFIIPGVSPVRVVSSLRMTPAIIGTGLLESVPDEIIEALSDPHDLNQDGISGRVSRVPDAFGLQSIGRFGFRARQPSVLEQTAAALADDIGITNPVFLREDNHPEISNDDFDRLVFYQRISGVERARTQDTAAVLLGKAKFQEIGCNTCHVMTLSTGTSPDPELSNVEFHPFTDMLLHDMGPGLADHRPEYSATGREWRTTPLWDLGASARFSDVKQFYLHDGRAQSVEEAILWHGGESLKARNLFKALSKQEREAIVTFLRSL